MVSMAEREGLARMRARHLTRGVAGLATPLSMKSFDVVNVDNIYGVDFNDVRVDRFRRARIQTIPRKMTCSCLAMYADIQCGCDVRCRILGLTSGIRRHIFAFTGGNRFYRHSRNVVWS